MWVTDHVLKKNVVPLVQLLSKGAQNLAVRRNQAEFLTISAF